MSHNEGSNLSAFILGGLIGAAFGILFAPAKGETTRKKMKKWVDETAEEGREQLLEEVREIKERAAEKIEALKEKWHEHEEQWDKEIDRGRKRAVEGLEKLKEKMEPKKEK